MNRSNGQRNRHPVTVSATIGLLAMLLSAVAVCLEGAPASHDLGNLIGGGKVDLSFRYRYEYVDQDGISDEAKASTLRSRLSLQSGEYRSFDFFVEVDDVHEVFVDDFNVGGGNTPNRTQYPRVDDPEGTEVNQVYVGYSPLQNWTWRLGRQRINFDNQRFVGGVGWRQNEQTYDSLTAVYRHGDVAAQYAYVTKVRRIFGDDVPAGMHDQDGTHLVNLSGDLMGLGKISGYYYRIDNDDSAAASTSTYGLRLSGLKDIGDFGIRYVAEYAAQSDAANNPVGYDADYWNLDAGMIFGNFDVGLGWEVLTGDADTPGEAFRTPFATLHAFNGWADKFLATPDAGLDDRYLKFKGTFGKTIVQVRLHRFEAEDGGADLGDEVDLQVGYALNDRLRGDLFFAGYDGDGGIADTDKLWLMLTMKL